MIPQVGGFQGCYLDNHRNNWRCARAVRALCENAPYDTLACLDADLVAPVGTLVRVQPDPRRQRNRSPSPSAVLRLQFVLCARPSGPPHGMAGTGIFNGYSTEFPGQDVRDQPCHAEYKFTDLRQFKLGCGKDCIPNGCGLGECGGGVAGRCLVACPTPGRWVGLRPPEKVVCVNQPHISTDGDMLVCLGTRSAHGIPSRGTKNNQGMPYGHASHWHFCPVWCWMQDCL